MSDAYTGEIRIFAGAYAPEGWMLCQGQTLSINDYTALFAAIGTVYGGDGRATFKLPNLIGNVPIHQGAGTGLTPRALGQTGGTLQETIAAAQLPAHSHSFSALNVAATSAGPLNGIPPTLMLANTSTITIANPAPNPPTPLQIYQDPTQPNTLLTLHSSTISTNPGGGQPHANIMPCLPLTFIMCINGLFPQPS